MNKKNGLLSALIIMLCLAPSVSMIYVGPRTVSKLIIMKAALIGAICIYHFLQRYVFKSMFSLEEMAQRLPGSKGFRAVLFSIFCLLVAGMLFMIYSFTAETHRSQQEALAIAHQSHNESTISASTVGTNVQQNP